MKFVKIYPNLFKITFKDKFILKQNKYIFFRLFGAIAVWELNISY